MKVDWLIVGAGFTGCTFAERIATQLGQSVLLIDQRDHIGGNGYDYYNKDGILSHRYGPHIFHTNSDKVWRYLSSFTEWRPYYHRVQGYVDGQLVPIPFNLNSLHALFPSSQAAALEAALVREFGFGSKVPILKLLGHSDPTVRALAQFVYKNIFEGYTRKQWGMEPDLLDESVTSRVPILVSKDDRYFQDRWQGIPLHGYTELFRKMVANEKIMVLLKTKFSAIRGSIKATRIVYTGPIDEYFDYTHGPLPYRSLKFVTKTVDEEKVQSVATINYPNEYDFTRVTEQRQLTGQRHAKSTLIIEYPEMYHREKNDPYYPIPTQDTAEQFARYRDEAAKQVASVVFAGRLADYKYYNMDQAVARALHLFSERCR